jgi:hypothetical protein
MAFDSADPSDAGHGGIKVVAVALVGVGALAAAAALLQWVWWNGGETSGPEHPLAFVALEVDRDELRSERNDRYGTARESIPEEKLEDVVSVMGKLNELQFPPKGNSGDQKKLAEKLSIEANEVVPHTGYDGFVAAGEGLFERCDAGLKGLLSAVRSDEISMEKARRDPPVETFGQYRKNCGPFLPTLLDRGLVEPSGEWSDPVELSRTIAGILQRLRWATMVDGGRQAIQHLTPYETRLLMRWRIETDAYPLKKRREYVDLLERNDSLLENYDRTLARAKLAYAGRRLERARSILEEAADAAEGAHPYRRELEWLEEAIDRAEGES